MDGTSYAIWAILALEVVSLGWTLILVKISSERLEARIANIKIELLEWVLEEAEGMNVSQEPPTPFTMAMPYLQDWLERTLDPTVSAQVIPLRSEKGTFTNVDKPLS